MLRTLLFMAGVTAAATPAIADDLAISQALTQFQQRSQVPGAIAAVFGPRSSHQAVVGVRRAGQSDPLVPEDGMHIGSNLKAITAWLIARDVDRGLLRWDSRLDEIFPELAPTMLPAYRSVTIDQLLGHRAGILPIQHADELAQLPPLSPDPREARRVFTAFALGQPPVFDDPTTPGFRYSNGGYIVLGAVLERLHPLPYEEWVRQELLTPLDITSARFGWPAGHGLAGPWGHFRQDDTWVPVDPDSDLAQVPAILTPAGNMSLTLGDYLKTVRLHLDGLNGCPRGLSAASYAHLHTPQSSNGYAAGWGVFDFDGVTTSTHDGSLAVFYARTMLQPQRHHGLVILTNAADDQILPGPLNTLTLDLLAQPSPDLFAGGFESCDG
ncbi:serine hydrolase domain-containing protein [Tahibacter amnicola]|uniref:Beta-lactamase family protein n=1 Tax=Tahibacter amnicola TaxID=2976241 RepID=A0ABY6BDG5_9GAMM|nr:serine hydrolase domain-containing protein [Tahibacter amnicola]UXI68076.1 beta-lactamase family protein [Tahibacter amnicola]